MVFSQFNYESFTKKLSSLTQIDKRIVITVSAIFIAIGLIYTLKYFKCKKMKSTDSNNTIPIINKNNSVIETDKINNHAKIDKTNNQSDLKEEKTKICSFVNNPNVINEAFPNLSEKNLEDCTSEELAHLFSNELHLYSSFEGSYATNFTTLDQNIKIKCAIKAGIHLNSLKLDLKNFNLKEDDWNELVSQCPKLFELKLVNVNSQTAEILKNFPSKLSWLELENFETYPSHLAGNLPNLINLNVRSCKGIIPKNAFQKENGTPMYLNVEDCQINEAHILSAKNVCFICLKKCNQIENLQNLPSSMKIIQD